MVACALLAPTPMRAQAVKVEGKAWFLAELVPGVLCMDNRGQVSMKYEVHIARMESDDARLAGRLRGVNLDVSLNPDGTGTFSGKGCMEVGTWDAAGVVFTRTDGVWDFKYDGVINADGSTEYKFVGSGIGGVIDGMHFTAKATRGPSLTDPYVFTAILTGK